MRAPPGPEDGSDAPVTWAAGFLDTGGRRCRLRSATATPHVRQRGQHICQYSTDIITMRKRAVAQEYTASAQRSAETTAQRAQSEHTAVATATTIASTASAQRSQQCASGEHDMRALVKSAVLLLPVLCRQQRARSEPAASRSEPAASRFWGEVLIGTFPPMGSARLQRRAAHRAFTARRSHRRGRTARSKSLHSLANSPRPLFRASLARCACVRVVRKGVTVNDAPVTFGL